LVKNQEEMHLEEEEVHLANSRAGAHPVLEGLHLVKNQEEMHLEEGVVHLANKVVARLVLVVEVASANKVVARLVLVVAVASVVVEHLVVANHLPPLVVRPSAEATE
jgi:hypothetical protein